MLAIRNVSRRGYKRELKESPLLEKVDEYKNGWRECVLRMEKDPVNEDRVFLCFTVLS